MYNPDQCQKLVVKSPVFQMPPDYNVEETFAFALMQCALYRLPF